MLLNEPHLHWLSFNQLENVSCKPFADAKLFGMQSIMNDKAVRVQLLCPTTHEQRILQCISVQASQAKPILTLHIAVIV
jgi:hypothetical protein